MNLNYEGLKIKNYLLNMQRLVLYLLKIYAQIFVCELQIINFNYKLRYNKDV